MTPKPELAIYGLVGLLIIGVTILAGLRIPIPPDMWLVLFGLVAGGLGITVPAARGSTSASVPVASQIPAPQVPPTSFAGAVVPVDPFRAPAVPTPGANS